ncbi:SseB family protein [Streptomyces sp. NPDC006368]|uniref:SseB family protein n=1 Tax=Streptomyces sp. NPDC006368 TaxID=3156760 RepID=UPI0033A53F53
MRLREEIAAVRGGAGRAERMLGEFRRAVLLAPVGDGGLMSGEQGGVRWLYAFTDEDALARFAAARGMEPSAELEYVSILGARLVDAVVPSLDGPTGVAVDVADEEGAMLFPPVSGIVPDAVAVDAPTVDAPTAGAPAPAAPAAVEAPRVGGDR